MSSANTVAVDLIKQFVMSLIYIRRSREPSTASSVTPEVTWIGQMLHPRALLATK